MKSKVIADIFRKIAMILELKGENVFRIRAYERAAQNIEEMGEKIEELAHNDELTKISGVGADLAAKIKEIIDTGTCKYYEQLKKDTPAGLIEMLKIQGLGPKTVKLIYDKLKIDTVEKLEKAAKTGKLQALERVKAKTEENILRGISILKEGRARTPLYFALDIADDFIKNLKKIKSVERIEVAGSVRRKKETVRDIDILVVSKEPSLIMDKFVSLPRVKEVLAKGSTKSSVITKESMQVDLRILEKKSFGAALVYFTGSKEFNIKLRQLAIKRGLKINEYGVFKGKKMLAGRNEEEIFDLMKMSPVPAELREDRGEIEQALKHNLPKLVTLSDIRGDFHTHSNYSDGIATIEALAREALKYKYEYIGVSDHSRSLRIANGLSIKEVHKKIEEVKKINKKVKGIKVLCATEVDILSNGKLDYPDSLLKQMDVVIAAIHSGFKQSKAQLTKRIIAACKNRYVNIIAHLTGRLWGARPAYEIDLDQILKAACDHNVALEINCYPERLDINDSGALKAKEAGVKLALGTDAHSLDQFGFMPLGVDVARRGWLEKKDIINCMNLGRLERWLKK